LETESIYKKYGSMILNCIALFIIILTVYMQVGDFQFVNLDDYYYVKRNTHVINGITIQNLIWAFTTFDVGNWHPITWLSHMVDVQLFGLDPRGHHLTSVAIHAISSLLLLFLFFRLTGSLWQSSFVAALFGLHPLHVESVAWVAERKDVLSAFLEFFTLILYAEYVIRRKKSLYFLALLSFLLALMAKPMAITIPIIMLLIDYWPLNRYNVEKENHGLCKSIDNVNTFIKEKIPFFLCSFFSGIITIYAQQKAGAIIVISKVSIFVRIENALIAYVKYIGKTFYPVKLGVYYPFNLSIPLSQVISSFLILLFITILVINLRRRYPYLLVGWFWFIVTLIPVIGLIQVGGQSMADRYSYIPLIGLFIMLSWGVPDIINGIKYQAGIQTFLACAVIFVMIGLSWQQIGYWRDSITLYKHSLLFTSNSHLVNNNLGQAFVEIGDYDAAIIEYNKVLQIFPYDENTLINIGDAYIKQGNLDAAILTYQNILRLHPNNLIAINSLGAVLILKKDNDAVIRLYQEAIKYNPNNAEMHEMLGTAYASKGNLDTAILEFKIALQINPNNSNIHNDLGYAFALKGNLDAAIQEYQVALRLNPNDQQVINNKNQLLINRSNNINRKN